MLIYAWLSTCPHASEQYAWLETEHWPPIYPFLKVRIPLADCDDSLSLHSPFYFLSIMHNLAEHNLIHAEQSYVYAN